MIDALTVWSAAVLIVRWLNVTLLQHGNPSQRLRPGHRHRNFSLLNCRERETQQQCMADVWRTLRQQQPAEECVLQCYNQAQHAQRLQHSQHCMGSGGWDPGGASSLPEPAVCLARPQFVLY